VTVAVAEGGFRSFSVQDDGHGIRFEDLPILCERHTTSKLVDFEDLRTIGTFGFRGEALASISYVSNLTVTTMTAAQPCAYRAQYRDGRLEEGKAPVPCAGNRGTIVLAENLFYNLKQRREALRNPAEELKKIVDVVQRYALHYSGKSFLLKKAAPGSAPEMFTPKGATLAANIAAIFGQDAGDNLIQFNVAMPEYELTLDAAVSSINYSGKRFHFILFINHRLVESKSLKRMVRDVYSNLLAKNRHPLVYLSLTMRPENLDVNVHPTKQTVRFRHEDAVLARVASLLLEKLKLSDVSRPFKVASPANLMPSIGGGDDPVWRAVRVDSREQRLDSFIVREASQSGASQLMRRESSNTTPTLRFPPPAASAAAPSPVISRSIVVNEAPVVNAVPIGSLSSSSSFDPPIIDLASPPSSPPLSRQATQSVFAPSGASQAQQHRLKRARSDLTSVQQLLEEAEGASHGGLADLFREHSFVGCADSNFCLLQHRLNLYLIDVPRVAAAFFYQEVLLGFEGFNRIRLSPPPTLRSLLRLHLLGARTKISFATLSPEKQEALLAQLEDVPRRPVRRQMLAQYFGLDISEELVLNTLPAVLPGFAPDLLSLPRFVFRLCSKVNFNDEKQCIQSVARELAQLMAPPALDPPFLLPGETDEHNREARNEQIEHVLFGAMKGGEFRPPKELSSSGAVRQIASIDQLYKTFERC
jgi:DNA mismatch repair protein MLH1